ncbi:PAS domain S-box-containing protein [Halanaerobium saccharolyticum]|uniref:PAS domain S-box-containing protein n=1 Tax=Halanaerobium saccharolyticum TaxID=43595 RepID=A0A4R6LRQ2_9FIRM|nr:HD domain-containing phosphohydrolase [Halanaerobium saccharolyticum]TDO91262.1 PAS domain S-box-containing protein [Halanaerobium saccharolyticum]
MSDYDRNISKNMSEEYFDFLDQAPIGIFRTTFNDKIEYINSSMAEMMGAENVEQVLVNYQCLSQDFYVDSEKRNEFLEKLKKQNELKNFEYQAYKINGEKFWVSMNARVVSSKNNDENKIEGFVIDITERKEQEIELRNQKEELAASNEQLSAYNEEVIAMNEELEQSFAEINNLNQRFVNMIELVSNMENKTFMSEEDFFSDLLQNAIEIVPEADYAKMVIVNQNDNYVFIDAVGHEIELLKKLEIEKDLFYNFKGKDIYQTRDYFLNVDKMETSQREILKQALKPIKDSLYINIDVDSQVVGRLALDIKQGSSREFSDTTRKILESFSTLASVFFAFKRFDNLQTNFTRELITSIIKIMEIYDLYTKGHSENVAEIASAIAREMDLPKKTIKTTYWAGLVHDIGKLLVPLDIINKKGKLSEREYQLIKKHPVWGSEALSKSESLKSISEYILYHHEKWDGSGYPEGIAGDKIPIISQILGVADAWDAMLSKRAYRDPLSIETALEEIQKNKGSQFSPQVAEAFIQIVKSNRIDSLKKDVLKDEINSSQTEKYSLDKKEYFEDLFEESKEGIVILDVDFNIIRANDYFLEMFEYSRKKIIGKNIKQIVPETKKLETEIYIDRLLAGQRVSSRSIREKCEGAKIEVSIQAFPISLAGENAGYYVIYRDLTELEDTKRKYENIKDRYQALFENEFTIMLIIDPDTGKIVDANPATIQFYGWSKDQLTSMEITDINVLKKDEVIREMKEARQKNKNYFIFKHKLFNGEIRDVEVYSQPILFGEKEYLYSIIYESRED